MHGKLIYNGDSIPAGGGRQKWCFSVTSAGCWPQMGEIWVWWGGWVKVISGEVSNGTVISGESPPMRPGSLQLSTIIPQYFSYWQFSHAQ